MKARCLGLIFAVHGVCALRLPPPALRGRGLTSFAAPPVTRTVCPVAASGGPVVPSQDFRLGASLLLLGPAILFAPWAFGGFFTLLGLLIFVQTLRIRFVFDEDSFEVKSIEPDQIFNSSPDLGTTGENFAVGGDNRWSYDSFVNWDFFPSEELPVLVYFKETQTPSDKWDVGPGKWANSDDALSKGAVAGQVHFFPCIASAAELKEQFVARGCAKL